MLNESADQERRTLLRKLIYRFSESQELFANSEVLDAAFALLEKVYEDGQFRHYYSDIYAVITDIDTDPAKGNLDILSQNMLYLKEHEPDGLSENTRNAIRKLYDHTNLDISRINYIKTLQSRNQSKEQEILQLTNQINCEQEILREEVSEARENLSSLYANILSIMGIFVALFAFITVNSNISFVLTTENQVSIFWGIIKINIFVVVCIFVLVLSLKLFVINPLTKRERAIKKNR